jgi:hypothetical protein
MANHQSPDDLQNGEKDFAHQNGNRKIAPRDEDNEWAMLKNRLWEVKSFLHIANDAK